MRMWNVRKSLGTRINCEVMHLLQWFRLRVPPLSVNALLKVHFFQGLVILMWSRNFVTASRSHGKTCRRAQFCTSKIGSSTFILKVREMKLQRAIRNYFNCSRSNVGKSTFIFQLCLMFNKVRRCFFCFKYKNECRNGCCRLFLVSLSVRVSDIILM